MRSHSIVKRTLPCLAVVLAVSMQSAPAHAGLFNKMMSAAGQILKGVTSGAQKKATTETASTPKTVVTPPMAEPATVNLASTDDVVVEKVSYSLEKDLIQKVVEESKLVIKNSYVSNQLRRLSRIEAEKVASVATNTHTEIVTEYTDAGLTFRLRYDEVALKNPQNIVKDMAVLSMITSSAATYGFEAGIFKGKLDNSTMVEVESPHAVAELLANVREGSPTALARWVSLQARLLKNTQMNTQLIQDLGLSSNIISDARQSLEAQLPSLESAAAQHARKQQKALDQWKAQTGALDKMEAMQDKLDDLILKNDRKGVRQLLETYLPWAVMEPVEANTWKIWLDAIENPDLKNSTIAFRGLKYDTDKIQRRQTSQGEIYGFMSTVLTKNQGSYTRRLRSLSTNREKNGDIGKDFSNSQILSVKITDQMSAHARNPVASSFISFTYDPAVAFRFMGQDKTKEVKGEKVTVPYGGILVVKMDSRRMIPNVPSMFSSEIELLAPLIVFPDEVVAYKEGSFNHSYSYESFIKDISTKTGINFSSWATAKDSNDDNLKARYNREGHDFLKKMTDVGAIGKSCSKVF